MQWRLADILVITQHAQEVDILNAFFEEIKIANMVHYARSITQAKTLMSKHTYDLVMMDTKLPDGDGLHYLTETMIPSGKLTRDSGGHYPVVLMSHDTNLEQLQLAREHGVYVFMDKPITIQKLHAVVRLIDAFQLGILLGNVEPSNAAIS